jgi:hypothetical protein
MIIPEPHGRKMEKFYNELVHIHQKKHEFWLDHVFLSWQWWFVVLLTVVPWIVLYIGIKRESAGRLLYGGVFLMAISMFLDSYGSELGLWNYKYEVFSFLPSFLPWDLGLIPILFIFLAQTRPNASPVIYLITRDNFKNIINK